MASIGSCYRIDRKSKCIFDRNRSLRRLGRSHLQPGSNPRPSAVGEMPILMTKRHFLMTHQAFKNRTGNRKLTLKLLAAEVRRIFCRGFLISLTLH